MSSSAIIYQNSSRSIAIIDIPKSIENSQAETKRLLSAEPVREPFPSLEPKSSKAKANVGEHSISDLLIQKHLEFAVAEIKQNHAGPWCLPRVTDSISRCSTIAREKRKFDTKDGCQHEKANPCSLKSQLPEKEFPNSEFLYHNDNDTFTTIKHSLHLSASIPPRSTVLNGDILSTRSIFTQNAPKFDLIVMDPPWPNRSARRKGGYSISNNASDISSLLRSLPLEDHIADDGYVGVWITNKTIFRDLTMELFQLWGVEFVEEWIWLKVTCQGEPICALDSLWRKPYEILLVGKKGGSSMHEGVERRVVVGVPDLHSRKPSLKFLFEDVIQKTPGEYQGLEIFARNLTEGWWGWGNEVLKFQEEEHWIEATEPTTILDSSLIIHT